MNDDLETPSLFGAGGGGIVFDLGLLEDASYLVANLSRLEETAVGERRVVWGGRGEMPFFVGCVEAIAVSARKLVETC